MPLSSHALLFRWCALESLLSLTLAVLSVQVVRGRPAEW